MNTASNSETACCGAAAGTPAYRPVPVIGRISTPAGPVDKVSTRWSWKDYAGLLSVRLDMGRMNYAVAPGLYAAGDPGPESPVMVSANYKYSFDVLRRSLAGINAWILVLDSKGVNVWCAAGKGTFGTMELARRVALTRLPEIVSARTLIVPQLGAPGIAAHMVKTFCDFNVRYGPVRAGDIIKYLAAGMKADTAMRRVEFGAFDRLAVAWMEMVHALKAGLIASLAFPIAGGVAAQELSLPMAWAHSRLFIGLLWAAILSGTIVSALLLPWLPGRAFSLKGGIAGAGVAAGILCFAAPVSVLTAVSAVLGSAAVSAYLALNYTGASTFTSPSGVKKEMRAALPVMGGLLALAGLLQLLALIGRN